MIQTRLSSPAQIIVFGEEGPDRHLSHWGQLEPQILHLWYPAVGVLPGPMADSKTLGFREGCSEVQIGARCREACGGKIAG